MSDPIEAASTTNIHAPAANTAAVVTYAAQAGKRHKLYRIDWSYDAAPTGGSIQVTDGGTVVWGPHYITSGGPGFTEFVRPLMGAVNSALVVTLAAPGGSVKGSVTCQKITIKGDDATLGLY